MNPFDPSVLRAMWGAGGQSFLDAQRSLFEAAMKAAPGAAAAMADTAGLAAAEEALRTTLAEAEAIASAVSAGLRAGPWADPVAMRMVERIFDPRGWVREAGGPGAAFGLPPGMEAKLAALSSAWTASRRLRLEHDALILDAWRVAAGRFAERLAAAAATGKASEDPTTLMALWVEIADEALRGIQRTEPFLANQRASASAAADLRLAQIELGTLAAETCGLPTRAEFDDVHRSVTEMRREIRALASAKVVSSGSPRAEVPGKARGAPRDEDAGRKPKRAKATPASRAGSKAPCKPVP